MTSKNRKVAFNCFVWCTPPCFYGWDSLPCFVLNIEVLESILGEYASPVQPMSEPSEQVEALQETIKILKENQAPKYDLRGATFGGGVAENVYGDQVGSKQVNRDK